MTGLKDLVRLMLRSVNVPGLEEFRIKSFLELLDKDFTSFEFVLINFLVSSPYKSFKKSLLFVHHLFSEVLKLS